ncbi:unnamed protein product [Owenia fusiformis]|uniref:Transmembrane protein 131 n=1 Tax=Owenia fusiformis TaxID=6347 RepID=A0A8S4N7X7_OWEFU|nr:unnamed protein product [Owenia fusiformis]
MAAVKGKRIVMAIIAKIFILSSIFTSHHVRVDAVESHGQAFIQTHNGKLEYTSNGFGLPSSDALDLSVGDDGYIPVQFDPYMLDFGEQSVGIPNMQTVTLRNPDPGRDLDLLSISGSTVHFHCAFFKEKVVPPGGNTTFDVVFLAREVGSVENTLYIHTSQGVYKYQVFGVGIANPYRVKPYLGVRLPINQTFAQLIYIHNPHRVTLQVTEMFSSGGDLHLELPTGADDKEAVKSVWEIPPYETRPVMRAAFVGRTENNHTSFIRIKTNTRKKDLEETLVIPMELESSSAPGIYSPYHMIDFGIVRSLDESKTLSVYIINGTPKELNLWSVSVQPPNSAISIWFEQHTIITGKYKWFPIAEITFKASKVKSKRQWTGNIIIKADNGEYKLTIPYRAVVLRGSLEYEENKTKFHIDKETYEDEVIRDITVTNHFNFTIAVYNISLPETAAPHLSIVDYSLPLHLEIDKAQTICKLMFHPNSSDLHFNTKLHIHSNASVFHIPIIIYNGRLKVLYDQPDPQAGQLDFGTMGVGEQRSMTFSLNNVNPLEIVVPMIITNLPRVKVTLLGLEKGEGRQLTKQHNISGLETNPLVIPPGHFAVFKAVVSAPKEEGYFINNISISTQYENLQIPLKLRAAKGSLTLKGSNILLSNAFPGKIPYRNLTIHSSFSQSMELQKVMFQPHDSRFYFTPAKDLVVLEPNKDTKIGTVYFDVQGRCRVGDTCYAGQPTSTQTGHRWLVGMTLEEEVANTDQYLYTRFQQKWDEVKPNSVVNTTLQVDTSQVKGFHFSAQASLQWPSLVKKSAKIKFPLTQLGNISISTFTVENPSELPVLLQILPISHYPSPQTILNLMADQLPSYINDVTINNTDTFILSDLEQYNSSFKNPFPQSRKQIEVTLGVKPDRKTIAMLLGPGERRDLHVGFTPTNSRTVTSLILIRNNLTVIDTVVVQGRGGQGELKISSKPPGVTLKFDMKVEHLKNCERSKKNPGSVPNFTVKKEFLLKNTGQLPFYVHSLAINKLHCEGYGFKVLECNSFELLPNVERKINIAFTPDFTMSRVQRKLSVYTSLGPPLNYTLMATLPAFMLSKCSASLPRPPWEPVVYYSTICTMGFVLFCIMVATYLEADRILTSDILRQRTRVANTFDRSKIFDLRTLANMRYNNEAKSTSLQKNGHDISNGNLDKHKKDESSTITVTNNIQQNNTPIRSIYERQGSCEKEVKSNNNLPNNMKLNTETDTVALHDPTMPSCVTNIKDTLKKSKAPRKQQNISSLDMNNMEMNFSKLPSSKDMLLSNKKIENDLKTVLNNEKNRTQISNHSNTHTSTQSTNTPSSNILDEINLETLLPQHPDITMAAVDDVDDNTTDSANKKDFKSKTKRRQPKALLKRAEKDRRQKEKQQRKEMIEVDKDETSSTTTESSGVDVDEKPIIIRELTLENEPTTTQTEKPDKKAKMKLAAEIKKKSLDICDDMDDFELQRKAKASKGKAEQQIKYKREKISLPYVTENERKEAKQNPLSPHQIANDAAAKILKKNKPSKLKTKGPVRLITADSDSSEVGKDSPPINQSLSLWDPPSPILHDNGTVNISIVNNQIKIPIFASLMFSECYNE